MEGVGRISVQGSLPDSAEIGSPALEDRDFESQLGEPGMSYRGIDFVQMAVVSMLKNHNISVC